MDPFLIIADDFTGALDTGVQFASAGMRVLVSTNTDPEFENVTGQAEVVVLDAETRHLPCGEAGERVKRIVEKAKNAGIQKIMKKTDSALRGNIGAELTALLNESGRNVLHFFPAFPDMNRTTKGGVQYVDGIRVSDSVFGKDPFEPVRHSNVADIIHEQSDTEVVIISDGNLLMQSSRPVIAVYDTCDKAELERYAEQLILNDEFYCIAGCAGLAKALNAQIGAAAQNKDFSVSDGDLLVICGSVNPVTVRQLDFAERHGFRRIRLTMEQKMDADYFGSPAGKKVIEEWAGLCRESGNIIFDTNDIPGGPRTLDIAAEAGMTREDLRISVSKTLGMLAKGLLDEGIEKTLFITGGDTLLECLNSLSADSLFPIGEVAPGSVMSKINYNGRDHTMITKSGGFGDEDLLVKLLK